MATAAESNNYQKYGVPIYGAAWIPRDAIRSALRSTDGDEASAAEDDNKSPVIPSYVVLAGGGGEGRSGIPNAVLLAEFDFETTSLSNEPVVNLRTGGDLPYRMSVHPGGEGLICAMPNSFRWFQWEASDTNGERELSVRESDNALVQLEDIGLQLALAFSKDGSMLAAGGEDGKLRVFKWPSVEIILNKENAHSSVKDLDFSPDGKFLVSVGSGLCRVWNVTSSEIEVSLPRETDEIFSYCRFSQRSDGNPVLYTTVMHGKGGRIVTWNTSSWKRIASKRITGDPVSAFSVSDDAKFLAIGTTEGDVLVLSSSTMQVQMTVKKAHLGIVTALMFSHDSRALVSAAMDSSVRVTIIENKSKNGFPFWLAIIILLLAVIVFLLKTQKLTP
ncbi:SEC12-like protein [Drosera capensis]